MLTLLNEISEVRGGWAMVIVGILLVSAFFFYRKEVMCILKRKDQQEYKE